MLKFKILKAEHGDCIIITVNYNGNNKNILIDGGTSGTFRRGRVKGPLLKELEKISYVGEKIDLLILTHIDDDHIAGLLQGFKKNGSLTNLTQAVWFNSSQVISQHLDLKEDSSKRVFLEKVRSKNISGHTSVRQAITLEEHLERLEIWDKGLIKSGDVFVMFGVKITILSPNESNLKRLYCKWQKEKAKTLTGGLKGDYQTPLQEMLNEDEEFIEDTSVHNGSSIAFLLESNYGNLIFLGDAYSSVVEEQLENLGYSESNPINVDYIKLSHHGSKFNTGPKFLSMVSCDNFIISSNTRRFNLPNKRTFARILKHRPESNFYFNYEDIIKKKVFSNEDLKILEDLGASCIPCLEQFELK
ncbi:MULTISPECIES: MBL fold metallo-hydrolase [unclassified Pseudoalteromonas]|uniref:ComEC/Rec2 family competence protein n=1 Tax=unclassified Pseudoalteromonas TaxID=194690 RepID=UPI000C07BD6F|nr:MULTISPECIES: MBL fold metallo-hydrolase [unclassified Pseudoalteromonas]MDP2636743.1 MBL fold metallo-hydrolase [Pseudoalteromonas sp. 1_MG-2023]PHN88228.1 MBL fold metallo-hydrolase [Pseudoalteromonas sp. 3D05]